MEWAKLLIFAGSLLFTDCQQCGNCVFPFTFSGWIHSTCTTVDGDPQPWCSTLTDSNGNHVAGQGQWEYCQAGCPGVSNPPISVDERNQPGKCFCGVPNRVDGNRIVGGSETEVGEYPWQVSLLMSSSVSNHLCGGSLISSQHVITAAHCTEGRGASDIFVSIGDSWKFIDNEADSTIIPVKTIKQHPDYNSQSIQNDISILELEQAVDLFSKPNIKPVCLPSGGKTYNGEDSIVSGWGSINSGAPSPANLHAVKVQIYGDCGTMTQYLTDDMICAGDLANGGVDSCQGDSGGPLFLPDASNGGGETLAGVVSWGFGCGDADSLGIYAEVSHFRDWIDTQISGDIVCPAPGEEPITTPAATPSPTTVTTTATLPSIVTDTSTPSIPCTTANTDTTSAANTDCWGERKQLLSSMKVFDTKKKVKTAEDCHERCLQNPDCVFFKFKYYKKVGKRVCQLLKVSTRTSKNWTYGPRVC